ncbi:MAG: hypothetical protein OXF74_14830 [Rhodobacteraceae bacterium]|nr:hypothetical protein [Paracoccaceae bacterium]
MNKAFQFPLLAAETSSEENLFPRVVFSGLPVELVGACFVLPWQTARSFGAPSQPEHAVVSRLRGFTNSDSSLGSRKSSNKSIICGFVAFIQLRAVPEIVEISP